MCIYTRTFVMIRKEEQASKIIKRESFDEDETDEEDEDDKDDDDDYNEVNVCQLTTLS